MKPVSSVLSSGNRKPNKRTRRYSGKRKTKIHIPKSFRTLLPLLTTYIGIQVTLELKNDTEITGTLDEVMYPSMNCILVHCTMKSITFEFDPQEDLGQRTGNTKSIRPCIQWARTKEVAVDRTFVHGSTIRYVHFPDRVNVHKQLAVADRNTRSTKQLYDRGVRPEKKREHKR